MPLCVTSVEDLSQVKELAGLKQMKELSNVGKTKGELLRDFWRWGQFVR